MLLALSLTVAALGGYFLYSFRSVEREILQANETILSMVNDGIVNATREIRSFSYGIAYNFSAQRSLSETDTIRLIESVRDFYQVADLTQNTNELIDDIAVFTRDLSIFRNLSQALTYCEYKKPLLEFLERTPRGMGQFVAVDGESGDNYLCFVMPIHEYTTTIDTTRDIGYCLTSFSAARIGIYFRRIAVLRNSIVAIVDQGGRPVIYAAPDPKRVPDVAALLSQPRRFLIGSRFIQDVDYTLYSFLPRRDITLWQRGFLVLSVLLVGILLSVTVMTSLRFSQKFSAPLDRLVRQLRAIDGTDPGLRIQAIPPNEIGMIGANINRMLDKIHDLGERGREDQRKINDMELQAKEAELLALQAQINPHFMYNTLECVRSLGMDYGSPEIVQVSTALADILRYCLRGDREVALREEIGIVREYLEIIRLRFGDRYEFRVEADEEILGATVVKMILQPLVENAVFHGLESRRRGVLRVECRRKGERILFTVADDGRGIDANSLADLRTDFLSLEDVPASPPRDRRSLGLLNIHRRIRARYGPAYGLAIESRVEEGTTVTIRLPVVMAAGIS
jgi:two-component system, sensor histidine kinase YesM